MLSRSRHTKFLPESCSKFLENEGNVNSSIQVMTISHQIWHNWKALTYGTGVHLAAYFGLAEITTALLNNGCRTASVQILAPG